MLNEKDSFDADHTPRYTTVTCTFTILDSHLDRLRDLYEGVVLSFTPHELLSYEYSVGSTQDGTVHSNDQLQLPFPTPPELCS